MTRVQLARRSMQVLPIALVCVWASLPAAESSRAIDAPAGMIRYETPGGETYFALSLRAASTTKATATSHDHVVLMDTSASQAGAHRAQQLGVLEGFLKTLSPNDRVALYAVDVKVQPLTKGFVAAGSPELAAASASLKRRVPLGSTELLPALQTALKAVDGQRPAGVVYIGDGMSSGKLIEASEMQALVTELRKAELPVHSFAVGPRTDVQLLGLLAAHTGGVVIVDDLVNDTVQSPADLGASLARAAVVPVQFPTRIATEPALPELLPDLPPIRSDRDTVLIGHGSVPETVKVTADVNGQSLTWTVKPSGASIANTFLTTVYTIAQRDKGLSFPLAGKELVNYARQAHEDIVMQMVSEGNRAVASRDLRRAQDIAWQIRQLDPENVQSKVILHAAEEVGGRALALNQDADAQPAEAPAEAPPAAEDVPPPPAGDVEATVQGGDPLSLERELRAIRAQQRRQEVQQAIDAADREKSELPDEVINELKQLKSTIDSDPNVDADVRETLSARLTNKVLEVQGEKVRIEQVRQEAQRRDAQRQAERRTLDLLAEKEEKLERRIEQVRALMARGFSGDESAFPEAESVARMAFELDPYSGITSAAVFNTEAAGQLDQAQRLRARRADRFLETLHQTEIAHIPFPDEPPVAYPPAEVWQFLTQKRKKWESVDLVRNNPIEEKIRRTLSSATTVNFDQNPFEDAIKFIGDQHGINIVIDKKTLEDEGIDTAEPLTLKLDGISLRSVLKLLLEPMQLTYIIEDEVMKITTATNAGSKLSTRVYYVGDLVIPIVTAQGAGIGQGFGGAGGFGGAQGPLGGGQFGIGGGGQGGNGFGGGGMGMGFPSVASEEVPEEFNNAAIQARKKKLPR